jgi:polyadenylate-binding protein
MNTPAYASGSLYVGDLHPDITEAQLFDIFKQIGPVASIRVCRDAVTRRSLGYAYVNYHNLADAERALDLFNYKDFKGKPCRIMWSQRDPSLRKSNVGNIFIKNLHKDIDNKALYDTFATFGNILSCKVATDEHANSRGYGFVHYDTQAAADLAVSKVNGKLLNGKKAFVGPFVPRKDRSGDEASSKWTNVYVKPLEKTVDEAKLLELFSPFGKVTSAVVMRDENGESKGFGFVNFENHEDAQKAIEALNEKETEGKQMFVGRAQKKSEREKDLKDMFLKIQRERMSKYQGVNLYVKNLEDTVDDEKLRQTFTPYGTITSAKVMTDDKGASKGFGFVCFATPEEATKAVTEMNGKMIGNKPIYVALAQKKEQRRAQLEAQHNRGLRMQQAQLPGNPMGYGPGAPVFYPHGGRGAPGGYMYPQQMVPRGGRYPPPQGRGGVPPYGMPPYMPGVPVPQQQQGGQRGGKGSRNPNNKGGAPRGAPGVAGGVGGVAVAAGYPGIKYNSNVRNQQMPVPQGQASELPLAGASPEDRKQILGENLYPLISSSLRNMNQENLAGKITGMILDSMAEGELIGLLESGDALNSKISEALDVLEQAQTEAAAPPKSDAPVKTEA